MAYQLKSTGIAAYCVMAVAVDPDTGAVTDFASAGPGGTGGTGATLAVGANIVASNTLTWDGNTRRYWSMGATNSAADSISYISNAPKWDVQTSGRKQSMVAIAQVDTGGNTVICGGSNSSNKILQSDTGSGIGLPYTSYNGGRNGGGGYPNANDKVMFGFTLEHTTGGSYGFYCLHDASSVTITSNLGVVSGTPGTLTYTNICRRNDQTTHIAHKWLLIAQFDAYTLSSTDMENLRDDWFGTLFESSGGGGSSVGAAANYFSQQ